MRTLLKNLHTTASEKDLDSQIDAIKLAFKVASVNGVIYDNRDIHVAVFNEIPNFEFTPNARNEVSEIYFGIELQPKIDTSTIEAHALVGQINAWLFTFVLNSEHDTKCIYLGSFDGKDRFDITVYYKVKSDLKDHFSLSKVNSN